MEQNLKSEQCQKEWYTNYYDKLGKNRNNLRLNPEVLFQVLAAEKAFVLAMRRIAHNPTEAKVLDVGCGSGGDVYQLLRAGYLPENISGIDIQQDRLSDAKRLYPTIQFIYGDASKINFPDSSFDLLFESTMFATLPDDEISGKIATEMLRVCRPGGYLLLADWRIPKPYNPNYKALTKKRLAALFKLGHEAEVIGIHHGALIPPAGRFLSAHLPALYFLVAGIFPFLVGQVAYLLRKKI